MKGVEDEKLSSILATSLIQLKQQEEGIVVEIPEPSSKEEKVLGNDDYDTD